MLRTFAVLLAVLVSGCAVQPQAPVALDGATWSSKPRVGVAMSPIPVVDTQFPGAGCLLCLAAASIANSSLTTHTKTLPVEDLPTLKQEVAKRIKAKGGEAVVIDEPLEVSKLQGWKGEGPNVAKQDFSGFRERYGIEKLVVLEVNTIGVVRPYASYIATSDPKATVRGRGYMVDLRTNSYAWYQPVLISRASDKEWDEPPKFPGLTNAYFQALEMGKDAFLKPFE